MSKKFSREHHVKESEKVRKKHAEQQPLLKPQIKNEKIAAINQDVEETKDIMQDNINKTLATLDKAEDLEDKTNDMVDKAKEFKDNSHKLKRALWWRRMKLIIIIAAVLIVLVGGIVLILCLTIFC